MSYNGKTRMPFHCVLQTSALGPRLAQSFYTMDTHQHKAIGIYSQTLFNTYFWGEVLTERMLPGSSTLQSFSILFNSIKYSVILAL